MIVLKKIERNLNDYGLGIAVRKSVEYIIKHLYENKSYRIYALDLDSIEANPMDSNSFRFTFIDEKESHVISQIEDMEEWLKGRVSTVIGSGGLCLVALDGRTVAGFNMVSLDKGHIPLVSYEKKLRPHEAWSEQISVNKKYRRRGLASALRYHLFEELRKRRVRKLYGATQLKNSASLGLAKKVGFQMIADVHYVKVLNKGRLQFSRIKDGNA